MRATIAVRRYLTQVGSSSAARRNVTRRHRNRKPSIARGSRRPCHAWSSARSIAVVMTSARRTARSARPTQLAKLLDLSHCKFLLDCLQQRLPIGERQAYVAGFGVRNISVQSRQFDSTQCGRIAIIELKNDGASHSASCSQDLRDIDNSIHGGVPAFLTTSTNRCRTPPLLDRCARFGHAFREDEFQTPSLDWDS